MRIFLLAGVLLLAACHSSKKSTRSTPPPQRIPVYTVGPRDRVEFGQFIDSFITAKMKSENIPGAAFVLVKDGVIFYKKGYGVSNIETNTPVDPRKTIFRIGSITKVFTADALLQLAYRKQLDLTKDVNTYLRTIQVPNTFERPITARDIMTHTTGLDEIRPGTQAEDSAGVQPLATFLSNKMLRLWPPGGTIMYSTYGMTLGGLLVEDISRQSYETYLREHIWKKLRMNHTSINVPDSFKADVATGYELQKGVNVPQRWEWYHTTPASSINSTAADMGEWLLAHLDGLFLDSTRPEIFSRSIMLRSMMRTMQKPQFTMHPQMPGMAYGWFEENFQNIRFLYHGGNMAGFSSLAVLIPDFSGFFFVCQHEGSHLREELQWAIMNRYYSSSKVPTPPAPNNSSLARAELYAGRYRYNVYCHSCPSAPNTMTFTVTANPDGSIQLNGRKWLEDPEHPALFIREDGGSRIAFKTSGAFVTHMYFGGYWVFEKLP